MKLASVVPLSPSSTATSLIVRLGGRSSLLIVPVPVASDSVAPEALERPSVKTSFASSVVSPLTTTLTVLLVCPGVKISVPEAGV